ncbi:hypothetical protein OROHE_009663 [Orobanche hederae]
MSDRWRITSLRRLVLGFWREIGAAVSVGWSPGLGLVADEEEDSKIHRKELKL